jgi:gamma-glutamyl hercynylcysteine S-oxide synthase
MHATRPDSARHQELFTRLAQARCQTDGLFDIVRLDSLYERPIPERHRIIFYLGHLEAFDWNLLRERVLGLRTSSPELDRLFAFGIDPVDGGLPADKPSDWPSVNQVRGYNDRIRKSMVDGFDRVLASGMASDESEHSLLTLLNVAIEHRLMHAETLAYMLHQLPAECKVRQEQVRFEAAPTAPQTMVEIPTGQTTLGLVRDAGGRFGWDNEYQEHSRAVPPFEIERYKVTNGEYLKFMAEGGYENQSLWTADDWNWKTQNNISHSLFWKERDGRWFSSTMFDEIPLSLDWPVYVSQAEASAYARWLGKALPTEAQWHRAAFGSLNGGEHQHPWGNSAAGREHGNFDFARWDPVPVGAFPAGHSGFGVAGMLGNGWEWTSTRFEPFPGFEPFSFYPGYSANFFDGRHYVLKGASSRTAGCMLRRSLRNWFQPHYQYVYAAFRCVSN